MQPTFCRCAAVELLALFHRFIFRSQVAILKCRRWHGLQPASAGARFMNRTLSKRNNVTVDSECINFSAVSC